jgi:hypothetical protein
MISTTLEERGVPRRKRTSAADAGDVQYVYHPSFSLPNAEEKYWGEQADPIEVPHYELPPEVPEGPSVTRHRRPPLTAVQERMLFLRYNYAKYRLRRALEVRGTGRNRPAGAVRLWNARSEQTRSKVVHANLVLCQP